MAEGWFKKEAEKKEEAKQDKKLIKDYDEMIAVYNDTMSRVQSLTDAAYDSIAPIVEELIGDTSSPTATGNIGKLRVALRNSRLARTETGKLMFDVMKGIEELSGWQTRYSSQLEQFLDAVMFVTQSAFEMIEELRRELDLYEVQMQQMQGLPPSHQFNQPTSALPPHSDKFAPYPQPIKEYPISPPQQVIQAPQQPVPPKAPYKQPQEEIEIVSEERKKELEQIYLGFENVLQYGRSVNPNCKAYTPAEKMFLKECQKKHRRWSVKKSSKPKKFQIPDQPQPDAKQNQHEANAVKENQPSNM